MWGWKKWCELHTETRPKLDIPDLLMQARNYEAKLTEWEIPSRARKGQICTETTEFILDLGVVGEQQEEPSHLTWLRAKKEAQRSKTHDASDPWLPTSSCLCTPWRQQKTQLRWTSTLPETTRWCCRCTLASGREGGSKGYGGFATEGTGMEGSL